MQHAYIMNTVGIATCPGAESTAGQCRVYAQLVTCPRLVSPGLRGAFNACVHANALTGHFARGRRTRLCARRADVACVLAPESCRSSRTAQAARDSQVHGRPAEVVARDGAIHTAGQVVVAWLAIVALCSASSKGRHLIKMLQKMCMPAATSRQQTPLLQSPHVNDCSHVRVDIQLVHRPSYILLAIEQCAHRLQPIPPCPSNLLIIRSQTAHDAPVHHKSYVCFVYAHAKGYGAHHDKNCTCMRLPVCKDPTASACNTTAWSVSVLIASSHA